jgi:energy-coupling factor transport system substrate-specific component
VAENLHAFALFTVATSLGWDIGRALTTAVLVCLTGKAVLGALRRAARRAAFDAPVTFGAPTVGSPTVEPWPTSTRSSTARSPASPS